MNLVFLILIVWIDNLIVSKEQVCLFFFGWQKVTSKNVLFLTISEES